MRAGAFSCYQAALQLRPNFPQGLNNLAVIFTAQGRAQDALQMLQAAIAAAPDYAEAYNNLGVLQREVGAIKVRTAPQPFSGSLHTFCSYSLRPEERRMPTEEVFDINRAEKITSSSVML